MARPKLLIVDDIEELHYSYQRRLGHVIDVFSARSEQEAREMFSRERFDAIAMDGCLNSRTPDTLELTREFRRTYDGPIIATSSDESYRELQVEAGCNYHCDKVQFPALVIMILELANGGPLTPS